MGAKFAFLQLSETFFSLHDISKLMENDLEGTLAWSLSTFSSAHQVPDVHVDALQAILDSTLIPVW